MDKGDFFKVAIKDFKRAGTLTPSSKFLIDKMLEPVDFSSSKILVELGAGEGCITREILKRMAPDAELYAFETNKDFCELLAKIDDVRLHIIPDSAEFIEKYVSDKADFVISGLPMTNFSKELMEKIVHNAKAHLAPTGKYIQYSYFPMGYFNYKKIFPHVDVKWTPLNIPPAFVYVCG